MDKKKIVLAILCVGFMIASGLLAFGQSPTREGSPETPNAGLPVDSLTVANYTWPSSFPNSNLVNLWICKNQSDIGFPLPHANPDVGMGANFYGTNLFTTPFWGSAVGWTLADMNNSALFPTSVRFVVGIVKDWNTTAEQIADAARWNPRIVGALMDDFGVGVESPANMSRPYALLHHEDANLTQGPLKLWLVVYEYNWWHNSPYTFASIEPYFDAIQFWYFGGGYSMPGTHIVGYENAARSLHSMLPDKVIEGGAYLRFYNAGYYDYGIEMDMLKIDYRLIHDGVMSRISILSDFLIANHPETAYMVRNFVYNELEVHWNTTWAWNPISGIPTLSTKRSGVSTDPAITDITRKWAGNYTFISHHNQNVTMTGFSGLNLTVQNVRTGEFATAHKVGSTWYFWASSNEEYKLYNWPHGHVVYDSGFSINTPTSWNNKLVEIKDSSFQVNSSFWVNSTVVVFNNSHFINSVGNGTAASYGLFLNMSNNPKLYLNNATFEPANRYFPYYFNATATTGTSKVLSIRNSTIACPAGTFSPGIGYMTMTDSVLFSNMPDGNVLHSILAYGPGRMQSMSFSGNLIWNYQMNGYIADNAIIMPGNFNGSGAWSWSNNSFYGGNAAGFVAEALFTSNTSFDDTLVARSVSYSFPGIPAWDPMDGGDPTANRLDWIKPKLSIKTDFAVTGTLKNATGGTIGTYSSVNGYLNVSKIPWAYYSTPDTVYVRNPFPWSFTITSALPAGYYYALRDESVFNENRTWDNSHYLSLNGTSFQIWREEAISLHLCKLTKQLWSGTTNYVNASGTLSRSANDLYWKKSNWTLPVFVSGISATTNKGTLSIWGISYNPQGSSLVASWSANHNQTGGTMVMSFSGLLPNQKYSVFRELTLLTYVKTDGSGSVSFTYSGAWSSHSFSMNVYNEGSGQSSVNAAFTFTANGLRVSFKDASQGHGIYKWIWDFGDKSSTSSSQDPTHTFKAAGTYRVTLTVMNSDGISDTVTKTVTVSGVASGADLLSVVTMMAFGLMFAGALIAIAIRRPAAIIVGVLAFLFGILLLFSGL